MGLCGVTFVSVYEISCADSFLELYEILASEEVISSPISFLWFLILYHVSNDDDKCSFTLKLAALRMVCAGV